MRRLPVPTVARRHAELDPEGLAEVAEIVEPVVRRDLGHAAR
jgi:hypothetical protein